MVEKLNLYKGEELITSEEKQGDIASVTISDLDSNTSYPKGTYQVAFENESGESDKVDVPEFKTKSVGVVSISLDNSTLSLETEGTGQLNVTVNPSDADNTNVTFSSSDESVATVDNTGSVLAIGAGTATITATSEDGNKTATCEVTVQDPIPDPPENVTVEPSETTADIIV
ncbi:major tail protein [Staphylococcus phage phiSA_BS2]|uniref:Major tail protein n=1 Tax=Staphylococcus phage phiSA_BS2 TaxID=2126724 RepID=A0A2R3ZY07_9CAUD|nr:major tail protein [Staphylococcus phage phiSA_BS2]AVR55604.1 major tail protein [Staphylococcus phage phiSA_BS2]